MDKNVYNRMMEQAVPSAALINKTKRKMRKGESVMIKHPLRLAAVMIVAVMMIATTAFAAWHFLKPSEVADLADDQKLSAAFSSGNAININATQTAGGHTFTLMSIVSGNDISDQLMFRNGEIRRDRTYAVVAIQKADGSPILDDFETFAAGDNIFYISPYIKGFQPWEINSHTLKGGAFETIADGVKYHLMETDDISIFADRGVYIGITPGRVPPYADGAFILNETTGEIAPNPAFSGVNILFNLPFDISLADPVRAQQYIDNFYAEWYGTGEESVTETIPNTDASGMRTQ